MLHSTLSLPSNPTVGQRNALQHEAKVFVAIAPDGAYLEGIVWYYDELSDLAKLDESLSDKFDRFMTKDAALAWGYIAA